MADLELEQEHRSNHDGGFCSPDSVTVHPPERRQIPSSSSTQPGEVMLKSEPEISDEGEVLERCREASGDAALVDAAESLVTAPRSLTKVNSLPVDASRFGGSGPERHKLDRSETERQSRYRVLAEEAAKIFDENTSARQKLKLLNRIATVKNDGTVEFDIPVDVEPRVIDPGSRDVHSEGAGDESVDLDFQYIPPMQIVMLIVGTRGDVQPFVAIGKRLQDRIMLQVMKAMRF